MSFDAFDERLYTAKQAINENHSNGQLGINGPFTEPSNEGQHESHKQFYSLFLVDSGYTVAKLFVHEETAKAILARLQGMSIPE